MDQVAREKVAREQEERDRFEATLQIGKEKEHQRFDREKEEKLSKVQSELEEKEDVIRLERQHSSLVLDQERAERARLEKDAAVKDSEMRNLREALAQAEIETKAALASPGAVAGRLTPSTSGARTPQDPLGDEMQYEKETVMHGLDARRKELDSIDVLEQARQERLMADLITLKRNKKRADSLKRMLDPVSPTALSRE
ncbi:hypothetical protein T484DRAFT_1884489 [Baffinella frigidus]|nr:hypothetical protein T484DRAFT_1884489 [Cryptophyta sp. CCMP2293]